MTLRRDVEKTVKLREFHCGVEQLLTPNDKDYLFYALKEYNTYKSVAKLMLALNSCLDTPEKLDLLPFIRNLIPKHDLKKFDNLAPYNRMAHPKSSSLHNASSPSQPDGTGAVFPSDCGVVKMLRPRGSPLGFSIRGGREHGLGIYVSQVDSMSLAEKCGLAVGDQLVNVNGVDFENITHSSAVYVLKSHDELVLVVRRMGKPLGKKRMKEVLIWVDPSGKQVTDYEEPSYSSETDLLDRSGGSRLLEADDKQKVVIHLEQRQPLGISIRGGLEYNVGIYVTSVDPGSPAAECGFQVGDQILDVNSHNFLEILHQEAVTILKSYSTLIFTLKSVGRIPKFERVEVTDDKENGEAMKPEDSVRKHEVSIFRSISTRISSEKRPQRLSKTSEPTPAPSQAVLANTQVPRSHSLHSQPGSRPVRFMLGPRSKNQTDGESSTLPRSFKRALPVSPLANKARAMDPSDSDPPSPLEEPEGDGEVFFEHGVGTQVMLVSATSQAEALLIDQARRLLTDEEVEAFKEKLKQYKTTKQVTDFAEFLVVLLDKPEKVALLSEIRSVIHPSDLAKFDHIVSPHEVQARLQSRRSGVRRSVVDQYNMVVSAIKSHSGTVQQKLRRLDVEESSPLAEDIGAFGRSEAQQVLHKAKQNEPDLPLLQSSESFVAWNESKQASSPNPVVIQLPKQSSFFGLTIEGGTNTGSPYIRVESVKEGGVASKDGFLKPGFEIIAVDGVKIRGKTQKEAAHVLAKAFTSERPSIELIVMPS